MTNEEIQRVMEFIIKQQESLSGKLEQFSDKLEQTRAIHEERISQLETAAVNFYNIAHELGKAQRDLTVKMTELAEAQAHTDQRLNLIIDIIEQGRGGKSQT
jgi:peptidoglycan hydrolase CwlO-like protein